MSLFIHGFNDLRYFDESNFIFKVLRLQPRFFSFILTEIIDFLTFFIQRIQNDDEFHAKVRINGISSQRQFLCCNLEISVAF